MYYDREGELTLEDKRLLLIRGFAAWFRGAGHELLTDVRRALQVVHRMCTGRPIS
jgi:hypothetical protein